MPIQAANPASLAYGQVKALIPIGRPVDSSTMPTPPRCSTRRCAHQFCASSMIRLFASPIAMAFSMCFSVSPFTFANDTPLRFPDLLPCPSSEVKLERIDHADRPGIDPTRRRASGKENPKAQNCDEPCRSARSNGWRCSADLGKSRRERNWQICANAPEKRRSLGPPTIANRAHTRGFGSIL